jgi:hypothetical protein
MRMKRLLVLAGVVPAAVAVSVAVLLLLPSRPKMPFRADFDRVRVGMTAKEVHAVMGQPYAILGQPSQFMEVYTDTGPPVITRHLTSGVELDSRAAVILFSNGRVSRKSWLDENGPTWLESVRDRLGW